MSAERWGGRRVSGEKPQAVGSARLCYTDLLSLQERKDKKRLVSKKQLFYCVKIKQTSHCHMTAVLPRMPQERAQMSPTGGSPESMYGSVNIYRIIKASEKVSASGN